MNTKEVQPRKEKIVASLSATVFLTNDEGHLLLVQDLDDWGGKWAPIAGLVNVHDHESFEQAAKREAKEELDLDITVTDIIGIWKYYAFDADHPEESNPFKNDGDEKPKLHIGVAYRGKISGGTFTMQPEEVQNFGFFTSDQVDRMYEEGQIKVPQYNYTAIQAWRNNERSPLSIVHSNGH